jgi:DNA-binding NtrC family response regulator
MVSDITVLVVRGEPARGRRCASRLRPTYEVERAGTVASALARLERESDSDVGVVLVDDELADGPAEAVVRGMRERGVEARTAVFTESVPAADVVDRGFDEFLVTPAAADELHATVRRLADLRAYTTKVRKSAELATERARIEAREEGAARDTTEEKQYSTVIDRLESLEHEIRAIGSRFGATDYRAAFRDVGEDGR